MGQPLGIRALRAFNCYTFPTASSSSSSSGFILDRRKFYQFLVLFLTFLCYGTYHLSRRPLSIVKDTLAPNVTTPDNPGWEPFSDDPSLLGNIDSAYLGAYAAGMFISGHIADRVSLRYFLTIGMLSSGFFTALYGMAQFWNIHNLAFFIIIQIIAGVCQSTGWPAVVAVVGNWFGKGQRGFIMGVWNSHTSVGNILGAIVCSAVLQYGWGWIFIVPGLLCIAVGLILFFFMPETPEDVGLLPSDKQRLLVTQSAAGLLQNPADIQSTDDATFDNKLKDIETNNSRKGSQQELSDHQDQHQQQQQTQPVSFFRAWLIPGVAAYAISLFFCKLVSYTFTFWLPYYLSHTLIGGEQLTSSDSGFYSTLFDVGGIIGGIIIGFLADVTAKPASVSTIFLYIAVPILYCYRIYGPISTAANIGLMILTGIAVQGPYSLITTAVSADLGTHESLKGNAQALATVTAIIDGTGSIGAALGPSIAGWLSDPDDPSSWDLIFWLLMGMEAVSGVLLTHLIVKEVQLYLKKRNHFQPLQQNEGDGYGTFSGQTSNSNSTSASRVA